MRLRIALLGSHRVLARALSVTAAATMALCSGCGHEPLQQRLSVAEGPVVRDLLPELPAARVVRATHRVEPGNPDHSGLLGDGWGRSETSSETGLSFAWVTGRQAIIEVTRLDQAAAKIELTGCRFGGPGRRPR